MQEENTNPRRGFLKAAAGTGLAALGGAAGAQSFDRAQVHRLIVAVRDMADGRFRGTGIIQPVTARR
jgi:anaerobic selenocysteine-containing dehydrogenase